MQKEYAIIKTKVKIEEKDKHLIVKGISLDTLLNTKIERTELKRCTNYDTALTEFNRYETYVYEVKGYLFVEEYSIEEICGDNREILITSDMCTLNTVVGCLEGLKGTFSYFGQAHSNKIAVKKINDNQYSFDTGKETFIAFLTDTNEIQGFRAIQNSPVQILEFRERKYNVVSSEVEVSSKDRHKIVKGIAFDNEFSSTLDPELIGSFDTLEQATEELNKHHTSIVYMQGYGYNSDYYLVTEYAIMEVILDEDGEIVEGDDIWEFSKPSNEDIRDSLFDTLQEMVDYECYCDEDIKHKIQDSIYSKFIDCVKVESLSGFGYKATVNDTMSFYVLLDYDNGEPIVYTVELEDIGSILNDIQGLVGTKLNEKDIKRIITDNAWYDSWGFSSYTIEADIYVKEGIIYSVKLKYSILLLYADKNNIIQSIELSNLTPLSRGEIENSNQVLEQALDLDDKLPQVLTGQYYNISEVWEGDGEIPYNNVFSYTYTLFDNEGERRYLNIEWERVYHSALDVADDDFIVRIIKIEWL